MWMALLDLEIIAVPLTIYVSSMFVDLIECFHSCGKHTLVHHIIIRLSLYLV
jgi:hypothetical protein